MGRDKRNENREDQFTKWIMSEKKLAAWKALSFAAREVYNHLRIRCFAETAERRGTSKNNNGEVFRSPRDLARDIGCSEKVAMAGLADLQAKGWIVCTKAGCMGSHGKGKTSHFRLTMLPTSGSAATREPKKWEEGKDYDVLIYKPYLPKPRKGRSNNFSKNKTLHPNRAIPCTLIGCGDQLNSSEPAPYLDAESAKIEELPAPHSDAYLVNHTHSALRSIADFKKSMCDGKLTETPISFVCCPDEPINASAVLC